MQVAVSLEQRHRRASIRNNKPPVKLNLTLTRFVISITGTLATAI